MGLGHLTHRGILFPSLGALRSWQSRFDVYSEVTRGPEIWQLGYRRCQVYTRRYGEGYPRCRDVTTRPFISGVGETV